MKKKIKLVGWSILGIVLIETIIAISCLFLLDSKVLNFPTIQYCQQMLHVSGQLPKISNCHLLDLPQEQIQ